MTEKPIGYQIRFRLLADSRLDLNDIATDLRLDHENFITDDVNPVVCTPADFSPKGSWTKALIRQYEAQEGLFNQNITPGGVARVKPTTNRTGTFLFFCVTRMTASEKVTPEEFYICLLSLRERVLLEKT